MTSISAIVPTYNRAHFLPDAISGLLAQSRSVDEIIVWDDGSTDETQSVVDAMNGPIRYFRSANGGKARALNAALGKARGDFIWICDDDDIALPDAADRLSGLLDARPEAGAAAGAYVRFGTDPATGAQVESGTGYWPDLSRGSVLRHLLEDIFLFQNATLVRRSLFDRVGPFREDLDRSIDYDMVVRLALHAPIAITEEAVFRQRKHDGPRGPAAARHAAAQSDAVWKTADRTVFEALRNTIPLSLYASLFEGRQADRAGLLQRATVYGRHSDWARALDDFEAAAKQFPDVDLAPVEQAICRRAMAGKHGVAEAMSAEIRVRLSLLARAHPVGQRIVRALVRGVLWRARVSAREGRWREAAAVARFATALSLASRGRTPAQAPGGLRERTVLPDACYL